MHLNAPPVFIHTTISASRFKSQATLATRIADVRLNYNKLILSNTLEAHKLLSCPIVRHQNVFANHKFKHLFSPICVVDDAW